MFGLALEKAVWDKHGKAGIHVSRCLKAAVERALNIFPERPAIGLDDHRAARRAIIGQIGSQHQGIIPFVKIFAAGH